ncbi:MAG TPA: hypothetical protein DCL41_07745 [Bdellovibrionales bacterium]|nr:hypothetical protein [Pseudobdellovibrionaceae bacterium]HAG91748.1 hypothetical protein [Bdellovibrionales bacterium]
MTQIESLNWLDGNSIRPYVYVRQENRIHGPGRRFELDWFPMKPLYKNPLHMDEVDFADQILRFEEKAFSESNMAMPRWVFYDCAVVPGFVAGFAIHRSKAPKEILDLLEPKPESEWVPISLFIIIPTMGKREWVAHNLCSVNALLPRGKGFYGLGFLTKAFGLWYANVEVCCGMTQWTSPAVRLHTHYGPFEILTAYTPVHSYAQTLTYRANVDTSEWRRFFTKEDDPHFSDQFEDTGILVEPDNKESLIRLQRRIEQENQRFFLNSAEIRRQSLKDPLKIYVKRKGVPS